MIYELNKEYIESCKQMIAGLKEDENISFPRSLPICILDAVFSIGANYISTRRVWNRYINYYNLELKSFRDVGVGEIDDNEHTIVDFISNVKQFEDIDTFAKEVLKNRQRTSSKNGILKAQASLDVANVMKANNINTISDFQNFKNKKSLDEQILAVQGQSSGIMLHYLYMLAGDVNYCKPDRHLLRFLHIYYPDIKSDEDIQLLMKNTVLELQKDRPEVTVRMLDNAIWKYQSQKKD